MGLTRQSVQRLANEREAGRIIRFAPNPHHQRAKLLLLTERGQALYQAASNRQSPRASALADGLTTEAIEHATALLRTVRLRLETDRSATGNDEPERQSETRKRGSLG